MLHSSVGQRGDSKAPNEVGVIKIKKKKDMEKGECTEEEAHTEHTNTLEWKKIERDYMKTQPC